MSDQAVTPSSQKTDQPVHPLLQKYDSALHAVTEQFRKENPDWWFWFAAARMKPVNPAKAGSVKHKTEIVRPEPK